MENYEGVQLYSSHGEKYRTRFLQPKEEFLFNHFETDVFVQELPEKNELEENTTDARNSSTRASGWCLKASDSDGPRNF